MNTFEARNNKLHWDIMIEFVEFVKEHSTAGAEDKEELDDILLFLNNVVLPSDARQKEGIDAWITNMHEPIDPKKVKYAKAVDRILSSANPPSHAMIYHAFAYRDLKAACECSNSTALQRLNLLSHNMDWSDEVQATMWKYFDELNRSAFEACSKTPPTVPSRDEIAKNIKSKKTDNQPPSMQRAFSIALHALSESRCETSSSKISDEAVEATKSAIVNLLKATDEARLSTQITEHSEDALKTLQPALSDIPLLNKPLSNSEWSLLTQIVTLSKVERAVPSNVMSQVEQFAHKLTGDLLSGKRDFSQLSNIESIGDELMSQLNPEDMSSLTEGVESLLPALELLKKSL